MAEKKELLRQEDPEGARGERDERLCVSRRALFAGLGLLAGSAVAGIPVPALAVGRPDTISIGSLWQYADYVGMRDWVGYWIYSHQMRSTNGQVMYCCDPALGTPWAGQVFRSPYSGGKVLDYLVYYGYGGPGNNGSLYGQTDPNVMEAITQTAIWHCLGKISSTGVTHTRKWNQAGVDTWHWAENGVAADPNGPYVGCAHIYQPDAGTGVQRVIGLSPNGDISLTKASTNQSISNQVGASFSGLKYNLYSGGDWPASEAGSHYLRQVTLNSSGKGGFTNVSAGSYWIREDSDMGNSGYQWNQEWVSVTVRAGQTTYVNVKDTPLVFVRFWVVDLVGNATQVHSCRAALGSTFDTSNPEVANANNAAKSRYPSDYNLLRKWYTNRDTTTAFSSVRLTSAYTDLYARVPVTVTFVIVDGSGSSHTVYTQKVPYRTNLTRQHAAFGSADSSVSRRWPNIQISRVARWYWDANITNEFTSSTLTGNITLYGRLPATVHFVYQAADGSLTEVHQYSVVSGTTVRSSDAGFSDADRALSERLSLETLEYVPRWYTSQSFTTKFTSQRVIADLYVYAQPSYGAVIYFVDGTTRDDIVVMPDGSRAIFTGLPLGQRVTIDPAITEAARKPGCTPGLAAWYTNPDDPAVAADDLPEGVSPASSRSMSIFRRAIRKARATVPAGSSKFESGILTVPELDLYAVNRATIHYELTDDSVVPRTDVTYRQTPSEGAPEGDVSLPPDRVVRTEELVSLPSRSVVYEPQGESRWRTLEPRFWHGESDGSDSTFTVTTVDEDTTLYLEWVYLTADGIVEHRG